MDRGQELPQYYLGCCETRNAAVADYLAVAGSESLFFVCKAHVLYDAMWDLSCGPVESSAGVGAQEVPGERHLQESMPRNTHPKCKLPLSASQLTCHPHTT